MKRSSVSEHLLFYADKYGRSGERGCRNGVGSVYCAGRGVNDTFPDTNLIFSQKVYISKENNVQSLLPHFNELSSHFGALSRQSMWAGHEVDDKACCPVQQRKLGE